MPCIIYIYTPVVMIYNEWNVCYHIRHIEQVADEE